MARSIKLERAIFICAIRPYPPKTYCAQTQILYKHVYYCRLYVAIVQIIAEHNTVGEVAEWSKAHAWKACRRFSRLVGSNPILSSNF